MNEPYLQQARPDSKWVATKIKPKQIRVRRPRHLYHMMAFEKPHLKMTKYWINQDKNATPKGLVSLNIINILSKNFQVNLLPT